MSARTRPTLRDGGALRDVAPTMLDLLGLPQPAEMTGRSLFASRLDARAPVAAAGCSRWSRAPRRAMRRRRAAARPSASSSASSANCKDVARERRKLEGQRGDASRQLRQADEQVGTSTLRAAQDRDRSAAPASGAGRTAATARRIARQARRAARANSPACCARPTRSAATRR